MAHGLEEQIELAERVGLESRVVASRPEDFFEMVDEAPEIKDDIVDKKKEDGSYRRYAHQGAIHEFSGAAEAEK